MTRTGIVLSDVLWHSAEEGISPVAVGECLERQVPLTLVAAVFAVRVQYQLVVFRGHGAQLRSVKPPLLPEEKGVA